VTDTLTTAVAANIIKAWPELTPNAAGIRVARLCKGKHLRLGHIAPLAAALGIKCDDLTSTETDAARAALEAT